MKKIIIALLIAMIIPSAVFASRGLLDLTVGAVASSSYTIGDIVDVANGTNSFESLELGVDKFAFGADVEAKVAFLAVDAKIMATDNFKTLYGSVSADLALDILFVRAKAGVSYNYAYNLETKAMAYGNSVSSVTTFEDYQKAAFDVNVGVDVLLGNLTIGAFASLPSATTIENQKWGELISSATDNWDKAKVGMTVGIALL